MTKDKVAPPRSILDRSAQKTRSIIGTRKGIPIHTVLLMVGILLIGFTGYKILLREQKTNGVVQLEPNANTVTEDVQEPEEKRPDTNQAYNVPVDQPRRIIIKSMSTDGFIQKVGLTKQNAVAVPDNIHVAGWYINSVVPGSEGLSIIDGHVSGKYENGIFYDLKKLKKGDTFQIEFGDKSLKTFEVVEAKQLPESESAKFLFQKNDDIKEQVNLITCGGNFNRDSGQFVDRVVIVSKLVL